MLAWSTNLCCSRQYWRTLILDRLSQISNVILLTETPACQHTSTSSEISPNKVTLPNMTFNASNGITTC